MIIIPDLENMTDALAADLQAYVSAPAADVWIFVRHPGGNARGKKDVYKRQNWWFLLGYGRRADHFVCAFRYPDDPRRHSSTKATALY